MNVFEWLQFVIYSFIYFYFLISFLKDLGLVNGMVEPFLKNFMKLFFIKLKIQYKNGGLISMKIKVVDSIMGSGKTSWAIDRMNYNDNKKYV